MNFLSESILLLLLAISIAGFILIVVLSISFGFLMNVLIKSLPEAEAVVAEDAIESNGTRKFPNGFIWFAWYFIALFLPSTVIPRNSWMMSSPTYGVSESFSICLLLLGAYFLARSDARPVTGFVYGACGVLLVVPYFDGIFDRGLWFHPVAPGLIWIQWIGLSVLLGSISAGIVVSVSRRKKTASD